MLIDELETLILDFHPVQDCPDQYNQILRYISQIDGGIIHSRIPSNCLEDLLLAIAYHGNRDGALDLIANNGLLSYMLNSHPNPQNLINLLVRYIDDETIRSALESTHRVQPINQIIINWFLVQACERAHFKTIDYLLSELGAEPNTNSAVGYSIFCCILQSEWLDTEQICNLLNYLIENGWNVLSEQRGYSPFFGVHNSPLEFAVKMRKPEVVKILLSNNVPVDQSVWDLVRERTSVVSREINPTNIQIDSEIKHILINKHMLASSFVHPTAALAC